MKICGRMEAVLVSAVLSCAVGAATNDVFSLEPVVVYASRVEAQQSDLAASVQVFDAEAIARSGARDLPELLEKKANVQIRAASKMKWGISTPCRH